MFVTYQILFPIILFLLIIEFIIPQKARSLILLVASLLLYYMSGTALLFLLPAAGIISYLAALGISRSGSVTVKKLIYFFSIFLMLLLLLAFRYTGVKSFSPVGLSFFMLEAISYVTDCYHEKTSAEKNPLYVILYIAFFPTVISGPIERGNNLIPQFKYFDSISRKELFDLDRLCDNAIVIIFGLFAKFVIADRLGIVVDNIFSEYYRYGTTILVIGALGFGLQLYCDFMAYSNIALGIAGLFGIKIIDNFKAPYLSISVTEFWRRWHISLSSWLRDYVYIPLGGNRKGKIRKYVNSFITFVVSGIWHGSGLNYLIWGVLHGLFITIESIFADIGILKKDAKGLTFGMRFIRAFITFVFVDFAWIFFRADSTKTALLYIRQMFCESDFWVLSDMDKLFSLGLGIQEVLILLFALLILAGVDYAIYKNKLRIEDWLRIQGPIFRIIFTLFILLYTIVFGIYGQTVDPGSFYYMAF